MPVYARYWIDVGSYRGYNIDRRTTMCISVDCSLSVSGKILFISPPHKWEDYGENIFILDRW
jgi:hypothetical protein